MPVFFLSPWPGSFEDYSALWKISQLKQPCWIEAADPMQARLRIAKSPYPEGSKTTAGVVWLLSHVTRCNRDYKTLVPDHMVLLMDGSAYLWSTKS